MIAPSIDSGIVTWKQHQDQTYQQLRKEYPDASVKDCRELASASWQRAEWVQQTTAAMRKAVPTRQQWPSLLTELGWYHICRRVFHDQPGMDAQYLAAGLTVGLIRSD